MKSLLNAQQLSITMQRLAHELAERHGNFSAAVLIGIQPRGVFFSDRLVKTLAGMKQPVNVPYGQLDITFYRDDVHKSGLHAPDATNIPFSVEGKTVVLVDDVLHTGRTIRAAMDALLDFGRPSKVELLTLIDRHYSREVPIQPDYTGRSVDTVSSQKVKVRWQEKDGADEVQLI